MAELTESPTLDDLAAALTGHGDFVADLISHIIGPVESNENGSYVRLENGLQICWAATAVPFGSGEGTWEYPAPFISDVAVFWAPRKGDNIAVSVHGRSQLLNQATAYRSSAATLAALAIGRWE